LVGQSYVDDRRLVTWTPAARGGAPPQGASRRQAWCYGTPGTAWTLWEAGRVLADHDLQLFAVGAMRSFCRAFEVGFYLYDSDGGSPGETLAICHGAAGTLAIADAFARHAGMPEAARLADSLEAYLLARLDEVRGLAAVSMGLQAGAGGVLATLVTRQGGDRRWLGLAALR
jgi:hypothetical protein